MSLIPGKLLSRRLKGLDHISQFPRKCNLKIPTRLTKSVIGGGQTSFYETRQIH